MISKEIQITLIQIVLAVLLLQRWMHRSAVNFISGVEHLFLSIAGHRGQPLLHCMACKRSRRDDHIFYLAGFVDRTRPAIHPLQLCVLVIFLSLGGSARLNPHVR